MSNEPFKETWQDKFIITCTNCQSTDIKINATNKYTVFNHRVTFYCRKCKKRGVLWRHDKR